MEQLTQSIQELNRCFAITCLAFKKTAETFERVGTEFMNMRPTFTEMSVRANEAYEKAIAAEATAEATAEVTAEATAEAKNEIILPVETTSEIIKDADNKDAPTKNEIIAEYSPYRLQRLAAYETGGFVTVGGRVMYIKDFCLYVRDGNKNVCVGRYDWKTKSIAAS